MAGTPAAATSASHAPKERMHSHRQHYKQLNQIAFEVSRQLARLASLGRPGVWILHHEDLYRPGFDTRPHLRNPDKEIPLDLPGLNQGTIWAGKGPAPDFNDIAFWEAKRKNLGEKIKAIEAGHVQPRFTAEELATIEPLEQQPGHLFYEALERKRRDLRRDKMGVFNTLFHLAARGRPGQWALHNTDLYHPSIDTYPATRVVDNDDTHTSIIIHDTTFDGTLRLVDDLLPVDYELTWVGKRPAPDFEDPTFWKTTYKTLSAQLNDVKEGRVHPRFTAAEVRTLERLESDPEHAFAIFADRAKNNPPAIETPESRELAKPLSILRTMVVNKMETLWEHSLAGKWVVHTEKELYVPAYDTHFREREDADDQNEDGAASHVVIDRSLDLRFDTRFQPAPHDVLGTVAYWEKKKADLSKKYEDVEAGRLTRHHFTQGERMRIKLLEWAIDEGLEQLGENAGRGGNQRMDNVAAWLGQGTDGPEQPERPRTRTPTPPWAASKRKRTAADEEEDADGDHAPPPPTKRRKGRGRGPATTRPSTKRGRPADKSAATPETPASPATPADRPPLRRSARIATRMAA